MLVQRAFYTSIADLESSCPRFQRAHANPIASTACHASAIAQPDSRGTSPAMTSEKFTRTSIKRRRQSLGGKRALHRRARHHLLHEAPEMRPSPGRAVEAAAPAAEHEEIEVGGGEVRAQEIGAAGGEARFHTVEHLGQIGLSVAPDGGGAGGALGPAPGVEVEQHLRLDG